MKYFRNGLLHGLGFVVAVFVGGLAAVTVSGTVHVFGEGEVVSAAQINENFASLKAAIESIPATNAGVTQAELDRIVAPVGSVMAWHKDFAGTPTIPAGWVQCDGQVLTDSESPYDGMTIPNLNGTNRIMLGNATSGGLGTAGAHTHSVSGNTGTEAAHTHSVPAPFGGGTTSAAGSPHSHSFSAGTSSAGGLASFNVVWIMRVK